MACRISYEILAKYITRLLILLVWQGYTAPLENHSAFNISNQCFSNTKCDNKVGFCESGHILHSTKNVISAESRGMASVQVAI